MTDIELEWFNARELAQIAKERGVSSFPQSERGVQILAERNGWNALESLCQRRGGRGGGLKYHRTILPEFMQNVILARAHKHYQLKAQEARRQVERKKVELLPLTSLRFRQRNAMEARGEILVAIDRYATLRGLTARRKAILDFVRAQDEQAERNAAKDKAEAGEPLSSRERMLLERPSLLCHAEGFGLLEDTLQLANDRSGGGFMVSSRTVQRWFAARDALGITALAPALTKEDEPVSDEFKAFLPFYAKGSKLAATEALKDYKKENPASTLTIEQVHYTLRRKLNGIERHVGREGLLTLRSRMAYISRSTENLFPTTIYTADGKTFDAEVEHPYTKKPFKPEITSILDVATRRCVGFAIAFKENVMAVTEALRNSCVASGIPAIFYTDRGPGYKNQTFDADVNGLMGRLSITKMHALPYNSQAKGIVERFNGSVWNPLAQRLPTYLGKPMDKEAAKAAHKITRREIAEIGTSRLLPTWDDFRAMCEAAIAEYNAKPHEGLPRYRDASGKYRHYSPDEFWALHVADGFEAVPVAAEEVDDLFRPYEIRTTRRALVEWNTNEYFHLDLEAYHGEKVMVGYDFADASKVWVREIDRDEGQPGKLICVAICSGNKHDYVPKTYQQAAEDRRRAGREKRVLDKLRDIQNEFVAPLIADHSAFEPMPFIELYPEPLPVTSPSGPVLVVNNSDQETAAGAVEPPRRRTFASDEELAAWALENPEKLTSNQVRVLRDCLNRQSSAELFRMSGIDLEALRNVLRNVA